MWARADRFGADSRTEYVTPRSNGLLETLNKTNEIFSGVKQTSDATLDSRLPVSTADLFVMLEPSTRSTRFSSDVKQTTDATLNSRLLVSTVNLSFMLEILNKTNDIFSNVKQTTNATLDLRLFVSTADLFVKRTQHLNIDNAASDIDVNDIIPKYITFMCKRDISLQDARFNERRKIDDDNHDSAEESSVDDAFNWERLGWQACFPNNLRSSVPGILRGHYRSRNVCVNRLKGEKTTTITIARKKVLSTKTTRLIGNDLNDKHTFSTTFGLQCQTSCWAHHRCRNVCVDRLKGESAFRSESRKTIACIVSRSHRHFQQRQVPRCAFKCPAKRRDPKLDLTISRPNELENRRRLQIVSLSSPWSLNIPWFVCWKIAS